MKVKLTELNSGYKGKKKVSRLSDKGRAKIIIAITFSRCKWNNSMLICEKERKWSTNMLADASVICRVRDVICTLRCVIWTAEPS